ncbi:AEC family transporter [Lactiplantibacillus mudanjiangensis]|uniref:Malate transport protein (Putative) [Lactobacillus plantarum JDM1] n=1 Tax=Lactiplantibacillus mudanjiangensis TaxID=1296538 RepID=A0A660DW96_9LACO|nr:AEC family transporter [Lactiplantibacillus mudanjiangensis]VDG26190.1 malate transport protein (putative) [Lactobacillus plantarum JDM1] [Lactiplantibacillus mudanjiangensis]VDG27346.1 malate transport protein (putative) [Lactobacillus plantarum JDM1] [Lactiplantibacillus mudanjiangensis]VDG33426.1 malate transport protein (putative) [Lactobacillus plantarum JDM1] [Lactiplantibacillus mudanjiangensis]
MNLTQLTSQIILMFVLMLVGLMINKLGFMHAQTSTDLTNILLYVVSPCLIIKAFEQTFSTTRLQTLGRVMLGIIIIYVLMIVITQLAFKRVKDPNLRRIMRYGSVYSNAGFMGIPLTSSLFGSTGVFFAVASLAAFNIFSWTHGITLFTGQQGRRRDNLKQIILNPNIIAIVLGLILFVTALPVPTFANRAITTVSSINTPLSMIVIGNSLADVKFNRETLDKRLWWVLLLRNLMFPYLAIVILQLLGLTGVPLFTTVLMMACPVAGIVVLFTLKVHGEPGPAVAIMSLSTILSIVTIPLVFALVSLH